jgi:hypothetical protein
MKPLPTNWMAGFKGRYRPACGGKEEPFLENGSWWLLCVDTKTNERYIYSYAEDTFHPDALRTSRG